MICHARPSLLRESSGEPLESRLSSEGEPIVTDTRPSETPVSAAVIIVIPTYNEVDNLSLVVDRIVQSVASAHILIVDDASPDGTGDLADKLAIDNPQINVMHRVAKDGLGAAYVAGFQWCLAEGYEFIVEMDADGSHAPEQLPRLLAALSDADLVLGARWVPGGAVVNWPKARQLLSQAGNLYARLALGLQLRDSTGGYRAYRAEVLRAIDIETVTSRGYCFQVDLAWRALRTGFRVAEVPITFTERERGESKMDSAIVGEALIRLTQWGLDYRISQIRTYTKRA
jgi:dolichol-phosphate mannosyltransferase